MNKDTIEGKWNELKGQIRQAWSKLTNDDVEQTKGNWEELSGRIQKTYGYGKEQANKEIENFKSTLKN